MPKIYYITSSQKIFLAFKDLFTYLWFQKMTHRNKVLTVDRTCRFFFPSAIFINRLLPKYEAKMLKSFTKKDKEKDVPKSRKFGYRLMGHLIREDNKAYGNKIIFFCCFVKFLNRHFLLLKKFSYSST